MISDEKVNEAFDELRAAFQALATMEDEYKKKSRDLAQYVKGSEAHRAAALRLEALEPGLTEAQRRWKLAGMEVDRAMTLRR